jgi:hypothetical protein
MLNVILRGKVDKKQRGRGASCAEGLQRLSEAGEAEEEKL